MKEYAISLKEILTSLFYDSPVPLEMIKAHGLDTLLDRSILLVKIELEKPSPNFGKFRDIASSLLISVNTVLKGVVDRKEKDTWS
jgi:hypothetical protein